VINEEHQQDIDHRNQIMARQIVKENKLQRGILGILSIGTPRSERKTLLSRDNIKAP
jgi:hypothetical protein